MADFLCLDFDTLQSDLRFHLIKIEADDSMKKNDILKLLEQARAAEGAHNSSRAVRRVRIRAPSRADSNSRQKTAMLLTLRSWMTINKKVSPNRFPDGTEHWGNGFI